MSQFDVNFMIDDSNAYEFAAQVADGVMEADMLRVTTSPSLKVSMHQSIRGR